VSTPPFCAGAARAQNSDIGFVEVEHVAAVKNV
jgi:hypothetical protein